MLMSGKELVLSQIVDAKVPRDSRRQNFVWALGSHRAQWQLWKGPKSSAPTRPVYFLLQQQGWQRSAEMAHPDEYLLTQNVTLTDMWAGRHRGLTSLLTRLWHSWHFPARVLTSPAAPGDAGVLLMRVNTDTVPHAFFAASQASAKWWSQDASHSADSHAFSPRQSLSQSFVGSSIFLIVLKELRVAKFIVRFTEGSLGWHGLYSREVGSAFSVKSNSVVINVTFALLFLMFSSSFSGFSFHLFHHSWLHLINLIFIL